MASDLIELGGGKEELATPSTDEKNEEDKDTVTVVELGKKRVKEQGTRFINSSGLYNLHSCVSGKERAS